MRETKNSRRNISENRFQSKNYKIIEDVVSYKSAFGAHGSGSCFKPPIVSPSYSQPINGFEDSGTRFRPLSLDVPKPLFQVAGLPMIEHHIEACTKISGLGELFIIGSYAANDLQQFLQEMTKKYTMTIRYLQEFTPLGTAGGLYHFRDQIRVGSPDHFFVMNGDVCADFPLKEILESHGESKALVTIMSTEATRQQSLNYGCLVMAKDGKVSHYVEKPSTFVSTLINCGVYVLSPDIFPTMAEVFYARHQHDNHSNVNGNGKDSAHISLEQDVLTRLAGTGKLNAVPVKNWWSQVKTAGSAIYSNRHYLALYRAKHPDRLALPSVGECNVIGDVYIHPTATIHPSTMLGPNVSIGPNAVIGAGVRIRESIVLADAQIHAHSVVLHSIVGRSSIVGEWARVEGTPCDPNPNKPFAKMENPPLFNINGKLNPSITILGDGEASWPEFLNDGATGCVRRSIYTDAVDACIFQQETNCASGCDETSPEFICHGCRDESLLNGPNGRRRPIMAENQPLQHQHEFLPLCDVLFNIISLASYFCDVVFDLAMAYALANHRAVPPALFPISVALVVTALLISQTVSLRWYLWGTRGKLTRDATSDAVDSSSKNNMPSWMVWCVVLLHSTQIGVLWRYFKLFIPVDLAYVKHEVRELCMLRLIHAFCEAAPMLLLQLYLLSIGIGAEIRTMTSRDEKVADRLNIRETDKLAELTAVSAGLSLWSVCWAVASFSKGAARLRNLERLVLTWLGVLAQLAWRLGTVSARVGALVAYASLYGGQWLIVVMALHWLSMLTWLLLTPDGLFHGGERLTFCRKGFLASLLAFVYVFAYVNLHETNHRQKMIIFYTVMFLENSLLIGVWAVGVNGSDLQHHPRPITLVLILLALFFGGLFFMGLYYRFFHIRRLRYEAGGRMNGNNISTMLTNQDIQEEKRIDYSDEKKMDHVNGMRKVKLTNGGIPGVFNCRFTNPTVTNLNRKKKKPTTFVPPPVQQTMAINVEIKQWSNSSGNTRQLIPFWKRPLAAATQKEEWTASKNDIDVAVGSLNASLIREKLREKKQQQLRELRAIQEEIKEGKLVPPPSASISSFSSSLSTANQQPPPNTKLHTSPNSPLSGSPASLTAANGATVTLASWPPIKMHCLMPPVPSSPYHPTSHPANIWKGSQRDRADTPEILLAPRCLPHHYPHWTPSGHRLRSNQNGEEDSSKGEGEGDAEISDIEGSQLSLPRSYTLPREFKYNNSNNALKERRGPSSKLQPSRFYLPSTNSSDGDVDSADNEETDSELHARTQNAYGPVPNEIHLRCFAYESGDATDLSNPEVNTSSATPMASLGYYISNSYGVLRPNQLLRAKVKHETKL